MIQYLQGLQWSSYHWTDGTLSPFSPFSLSTKGTAKESQMSPKTYHGKPCRKYGHTLRYKSNRQCVECMREYKRKYDKLNQEKVRERKRKWAKANHEKRRASRDKWRKQNPEKVNKNSRRWERDNREKVNARNRKRKKANRERYNDLTRKWAKKNPEKRRAIDQRYRAHKRGNISEPYDFKEICEHYGNKCLGCGRKDVNLTVDHIQPVSKGGDDAIVNIQPLCQSCNSSKGVRNIDYRPDEGPLRWIQEKLLKGEMEV